MKLKSRSLKTTARRNYILSLGIFILLAMLFPLRGHAINFPGAPEPLPGFTHTDTYRNADTPEHHGLELGGIAPSISSPVIADLDGDDTNGRELVVANSDGTIRALHADGSLLWTAQTPNVTCRGVSPRSRVSSSPAVGNLTGAGPAVVIGYGNRSGKLAACPGGVVAFRGADGSQIFNFDLKVFGSQQKFFSLGYGVIATPALADTDGDGKVEIAFGAIDRNIYLLNGDGTVRWYYHAADTVLSSPVFANIDDDPQLELIAATDITENLKLRPATKNGGNIYAFKTAPRRKIRFDFREPNSYLWMRYVDQIVWSSPAIGDIDPLSPGLEIAVGSGCFFPERATVKKGKWLKVLSARTGRVLRTIPTPACSSSSPALADLDGDGKLEIATIINGSTRIGGPGKTSVMVFHGDTGQLLWQKDLKDFLGANDNFGGDFQSLVTADLDGNGSVEVIVPHRASVSIFNGSNGVSLSCQELLCRDGLPPVLTLKPLRTTPAVGDINLDGTLDLVVVGGHPTDANKTLVFGWTNFDRVIQSDVGNAPLFSNPFGMFRGDAMRTGRIAP